MVKRLCNLRKKDYLFILKIANSNISRTHLVSYTTNVFYVLLLCRRLVGALAMSLYVCDLLAFGVVVDMINFCFSSFNVILLSRNRRVGIYSANLTFTFLLNKKCNNGFINITRPLYIHIICFCAGPLEMYFVDNTISYL